MEYLVDVHIVTYNQEGYIAKAIDSALAQQTTFPIRIFVGDDCSTDGTIDIIKEYERQHPGKVFAVVNDKNRGPKHPDRIGVKLMKGKHSKYITLLDGDDYWTDVNKLQVQVDLLESDPTVAGCFHDAVNVDENDNITNDNYYQPTQEEFDQFEALQMRSGYATSSIMFRSMVLDEMSDWFLNNITDFTLDLQITKHGKLRHIPRNMVAYRFHSQGIWRGNRAIQNQLNLLARIESLEASEEYGVKYGDYLRAELGKGYHEVAYLAKSEGDKAVARSSFRKYMKYSGKTGVRDWRMYLSSFVLGRG